MASRRVSNSEVTDDVAELSRLRAFAIRVSPIVKAAVELREMGRTMERIEETMESPDHDPMTRCLTPWLIVKQAYDTALVEFDAAVKKAALGNFDDLLSGAYEARFAGLASAKPPSPGGS